MAHSLLKIDGPNIDQDGNATYVETWLCNGSSPSYLIRGLYGYGFLLSIDQSHSFTNHNGPHYEVRYTFGPPPDNQNQNQDSDNPLMEPIKINMGGRMITIPADKDADGTAILNSVGDRFQDVINLELANTIISVTKNSLQDGTSLFDYTNTINSDAYMGRPKHTLRFLEPNQSSQWHRDIGTYWTKTINIEYNPRKWDPLEVLDCGFRYKNDNDKIVKVDGVTPQLLDSDGKKIPEGGEPHFKKFHVFEKAPFSRILGAF